MHAGLRTVNSAFPTGAMWAAVEAHAMRLTRGHSVKLFAAASARAAGAGGFGAGDGGSGGGGLYRCCAQHAWRRTPPTARSSGNSHGSPVMLRARCAVCCA